MGVVHAERESRDASRARRVERVRAVSVIERHYTTAELAKLLAVHPETVRREAARGRLGSVRVGSERRYAESAVQECLTAAHGRAA